MLRSFVKNASREWRALHSIGTYTNTVSGDGNRKHSPINFKSKKKYLQFNKTEEEEDQNAFNQNSKFKRFFHNFKQRYENTGFEKQLKDDICLWVTGVLAASSILIGHRWVNRGQRQQCPFPHISIENVSKTLEEQVSDKIVYNVLPKLSTDDSTKTEEFDKLKKDVEISLAPVFDNFQKTANECVGTLLNEYGMKYSSKNQLRKAFQMFSTAVQYNDIEAMYNLAVCYEKGHGVKRSFKMAIKYYEMAASQEHKESMFNLGLLYYQDVIDDSKQSNLRNGFHYIKKAADLGFAKAQLFLALRYAEEGKEKETFKYFQAAAKQNNVTAIFNLAKCFENGVGIDKNPKKALNLYFQAAKSNNVAAIFIIADSYRHGTRGMSRDLDKSLKWYECAMEQGNKEAKSFVDLIKYELSQQNEEKFLSLVKSKCDNDFMKILLPLKGTTRTSFHKSFSSPMIGNNLVSNLNKTSSLVFDLENQWRNNTKRLGIDNHSVKNSSSLVLNKMFYIS